VRAVLGPIVYKGMSFDYFAERRSEVDDEPSKLVGRKIKKQGFTQITLALKGKVEWDVVALGET
jgi:hypothetical protein